MLEANFDGLVGPTHNYAGLSYGNVASEANAASIARPREAALQGIAKMRTLLEMGVPQGILPPQERPHVPTLRKLGFAGSDEQVLAACPFHPQALRFRGVNRLRMADERGHHDLALASRLIDLSA